MDEIHTAYNMLHEVKSLVESAVDISRKALDTCEETGGKDTIEYTHARVKMLYLEASLHAVDNALAAVSDACGDTTYVKIPGQKREDILAI